MRLLMAVAVAAACLGLGGRALAQPSPGELPTKPQVQTGAPAQPAAASLTADDLRVWLDGLMPYALQRGDIAGAVVVVVKDGQILFSKGYGYADAQARTPVDPARTVFRPGSTSKLFTWTAVMQQVEQGKLDLDADVNRYLDFKLPSYQGKPVTLRQLMTHTGGFEETLKGSYTLKPEDLSSFDQYMRETRPDRIYPPGQVPAYSNYGTALAGYIVQRVSGEKFEDYIERHILRPLDMRNATFRQPLPARLQPFMSKGYVTASGPPRPFELYGPRPAGSLSATGEEMAHFMIAHLQGGAYGSARILQPETARLMHGSTYTVLPAVNRMALGFYESNRNGRRIISHAGDTPVFHSVMYLYVDDGVGLFVSLNSAGKEGASGAIRSALFEQFSDRYLPGPPIRETSTVSAKDRAAHAQMMAGEYVTSRRSTSNFLSLLGLLGQTTVTATPDGDIVVSGVENLSGQPKRWREVAPFVWREVGGVERLSARAEDGRVTMFSFDEVSPYLVFMPVRGLESPARMALALKLGLAALAITIVLWPITAVVRRRYGAAKGLLGRELWAFRGVRLAGLAVFAVWMGWAWTILGFINNTLPMTSKLDGWILTLHGLSLAVFVGGVVVAAWNAWTVWRGRRGWLAKGWSTVLLAAFAAVLWVAAAHHLLDFGLSY